MSSYARTWSPVVALAVVAALATMTGTPDPVVQASDNDVAAPVVDLLFMADRFEDQKRSAPAADLLSQF